MLGFMFLGSGDDHGIYPHGGLGGGGEKSSFTAAWGIKAALQQLVEEEEQLRSGWHGLGRGRRAASDLLGEGGRHFQSGKAASQRRGGRHLQSGGGALHRED